MAQSQRPGKHDSRNLERLQEELQREGQGTKWSWRSPGAPGKIGLCECRCFSTSHDPIIKGIWNWKGAWWREQSSEFLHVETNEWARFPLKWKKDDCRYCSRYLTYLSETCPKRKRANPWPRHYRYLGNCCQQCVVSLKTFTERGLSLTAGVCMWRNTGC